MRGAARGPWSVAGRLLPGLVSAAIAAGAAAQGRVLDDFGSLSGWTAAPSEGVTLAISSEAGPAGRAMRLDFDFHGRGGWAAIRRRLDLDLPANYEFSFRIRGEAPPENLEFKLLDRSGENVWWSVRREFDPAREWQTVRIKKRQISFAWGPAGGGEIPHVAALEIAITAGTGGRGTLWISDLTFTERPAERPYAGNPVVSASSSLPGRAPAQALTGAAGGWRSDPASSDDQWVQVDFGERREFGGLVIAWERAPRSFEVRTSEDGRSWTTAWRVRETQGGCSYVPLPEAEARFLRLVLSGALPGGVGIGRIEVEPLAFASTPNAFLANVASDAPRGLYPRGFLGETASWTLVGSGDPLRPASLLSADGAFEPEPRTFSLEPFLRLDGTFVTWAGVAATQALLDGDLPIPSVRWTHPRLALEVTALALDDRGRAALRYRLTNRTREPITPTLFVALRPLQVNPPSQFLNTPGGAGRIASLTSDGTGVSVDGVAVAPLSGGWSFGATSFDAGDVAVFLARGSVPGTREASDPGGRASGALAWELAIPPGGSREVWIAVAVPRSDLPAAGDAARWGAERLERAAASWRRQLDRVTIRVPGDGRLLVDALRSNLAYILASRDGPALRPGTRSYARSWIRDGAMIAAALLRLGHAEAVRSFLLWFAPHQFASGQVPCCVDGRGADPVAENDSNGELLFLAAEYLRFTGDRATLDAVWPSVTAAVGYLERLRQQRRTDAYRSPDALALFGLLPESISHEGYSAKPMHSYWDDFWALAGLRDAAWLAETLGHPQEARRWSGIREEFHKDLMSSIARVRAARAIPYIPGCAELGDFDATSTTVVFWPAGAEADLPREALAATFERYWHEAEARFTGTSRWDAYAPYEWRSVGAFVRLGWRERAARLAGWLMADRTPPGWNQWPEVVHHDRAKAAFLGDLPHAWVGSDFIRSFLDMLAYERLGDGALVLGAGAPATWLEGEGLAVRGLHTPHGPLSFTMRRDGGSVRIRVEAGLRVPPGGIVVRPPLPGGPLHATVDGSERPVSAAGEVLVTALPAEVVIRAADGGSRGEKGAR